MLPGARGAAWADAGTKLSAEVNKDMGNLYSPADSEVLQ